MVLHLAEQLEAPARAQRDADGGGYACLTHRSLKTRRFKLRTKP
jgi:hypothetical protein